jgi:23S rRNA (pseudouridine1915-N3)-methyltransferase
VFKIILVCVGKLKEKYYSAAQSEYKKMLSRFADVKIVEVPDQPLAKSGAGDASALRTEAGRIAPLLRGRVVACDIEGEQMTSEAFAAYIQSCMDAGAGEICFVVGGSAGLADEVKEKADLRLSFSRMTLPHRLFRIVLLEQVYRAFKILNGETYHK